MPDVFNVSKRSEVMSLIRSRGNKTTELRVAKLLRTNGIVGWRRHQNLIGRPDFTFRIERVAIFVDGCFWHGCPKHGIRPMQNRLFWDAKIARNKMRDREVMRALRQRGWKVIRIWEHQLRFPAPALRRIRAALGRLGR